ncbi:ATP-dependent endonuclease [Fluviicola sp.]|uniref:ATP-dependent endonuclease n=1 Tax=Fluviicola sp. TaxID=1917219 RepID=UPI003D2CF406
MKIDFIHIQNFRKLKDCRIDFSDKQTIFVGANNSGKTTAMDAMIKFLKKTSSFSTRDFTLSNWAEINKIGSSWLAESDPTKVDLSIKQWEGNLPSIDIWLKVETNELHYINKLIPTLDWKGGLLGVRLRYEPDNLEELYKEFFEVSNNSTSLISSLPKNGKKAKTAFSLWPKDMWDFMEKRMPSLFKVKTYLLNPDLSATPQQLTDMDIPIEGDVFSGLIKIDIINAQRGFSDANSEATDISAGGKSLSTQLRGYYDKHLNPSLNPTKDDLEALEAMHHAKELFDTDLQNTFSSALKELENLNYPGLGNAKVNLTSKISTVDGLNHDSSVQYFFDDSIPDLKLPEKYNGLGYQNLISIVFKLMRFRDEWMKAGKALNDLDSSEEFEPLHLVLIEEPEAHLHAQVQQVFIRKAYQTLRNHKNLDNNNRFSTQLVISTHSSYIAHEIDFTSLRYFKRELSAKGKVKTSCVVNLSKTFGSNDESTKFAIRYLKTTHCDLFFADAAILVEGPAERMLVPYFIKHHTELSNCYVSILEIGGSHAHTLQRLIENLGIITLVITDIDSVVAPVKGTRQTQTQPEIGKNYETGNDTLKKWWPKEKSLDKLLALGSDAKNDAKFPVKVAFQTPISVKQGTKNETVYPYTFEDSLVMENKDIFGKLTYGSGLLKEITEASKKTNIKESAKAMYDAIIRPGAKKAEFALELFFFEEPNTLITPSYIKEGLEWLEDQLKPKESTKKDK